MKKISYQIVAKSPIFTGSDENNGTMRLLRREKRLLPNRQTVQSQFVDRRARQTAALNILYGAYREISTSLKASNYGFYDAFANKVQASTRCKDKYHFLNLLCASCGIESLSNENGDIVMQCLEMFEDGELLETLRNETQFLMLRLRQAVQLSKTDQFTPQYDGLLGGSNFTYTKSFESIPYIGGNSIRGLIRRLVMRDFCQLTGVDEQGLDKEMFHRMFTGGTLNDSTGSEDMAMRRNLINICPPLMLLGSAVGNQTIEGGMKVGGARLQCHENGTGGVSFWELLDTQFGTRLDSEKQETEIMLYGPDEKAKSGKGKDVSVQMKYEYEVFVTGSIFDSSFVLDTHSPLVESCFYRALELFKAYGYVGGNSARDSGAIDVLIDIPEGATALYLRHLVENKEAILAYFKPREATAKKPK